MSNPAEDTCTDDRALVTRAKKGDVAAFDQLILRHQQMVFAVALRMLGDANDAQDIAQDAFVRAFRALARFRGEAKFSTWLLSITINLCRNQRRWWSRHRRVMVASLDAAAHDGWSREVADASPSPADVVIRAERRQLLMEGLQALDEPHRSVMVLRDVQGYSYEEIAQVLACELGTVKSRISRARLKLRSLLDGKL